MVLFDLGAMHSFVSPSFALCLDIRFGVLNSPLTMLTPIGEVYLNKQIFVKMWGMH